MSDTPLVPTADIILRPALEKMYSVRPTTFQFLNLRSGVYWHPMLSFRGQTAKVLQRLAKRTRAHCLRTASGQDLKEYVASEFDAVPDDTLGTFALGEVTLTRTGSMPVGDLPKGTKLVRKANLTTQVPLAPAEYVTLADVHWAAGQSTAGPVAIEATTRGDAANHPVRTDSVPHGVTISGAGLFDKTITVATFSAAGGLRETGARPADDDEYVRRFARAFAVGQYGPTEAESRYGALKGTGVRNILVYDLPGTGTQKVLVADTSWASSARWAKAVQQSMFDNDLVGFGCKVDVDVIRNILISVEATVVLRDVNYMRETTEIDNAIRAAVKDYFDNRADWNVWKTDSLKGVIARAHAKIFDCTAATVKDTAGATLPEISSPNYNTEQFHYLLANGAVKLTYAGPT